MRLNRNGMRSARYKIRARIGKGGQGEVYRASCEVVVKRLIRVQDPLHLQRLRGEFEAARLIDHPNVVKVLDGDFGDEPYIVMEYLRGEPLSQRMMRARRRGRALECVPLLRQAMRGVSELHAHGLIHRDLKPDNIFVRTDGGAEIAVVLDLGAVRFLKRRTDRPRTTGVLIGTPAYMAPEQAAGETVDEAADVYALGVTLYELLVGTVPCDVASLTHGSADDRIRGALEQALLRIEHLPAWCKTRDLHDVRTRLVPVVLRAIEPEKSSRYASVNDFALALERAVGLAESTVVPGAAVSMPAGGEGSRPGGIGRPRVMAPLIACAAAAVLTGAVAAGWWRAATPAALLQADIAWTPRERYASATTLQISARSRRPVTSRTDGLQSTASAPAVSVRDDELAAPATGTASVRTRDFSPGAAADNEDAVWQRMKELAIEQSRLGATR